MLYYLVTDEENRQAYQQECIVLLYILLCFCMKQKIPHCWNVYRYRSQKTFKCGKNIRDLATPRVPSVFFFITTF